jgi:hypothetical protein
MSSEMKAAIDALPPRKLDVSTTLIRLPRAANNEKQQRSG